MSLKATTIPIPNTNIDTELQQTQDDNRLNQIQQLLKLDGFSEETQSKELEKHRQAIDSDDQLNAEYFQQMRGQELDLFKGRESYRLWIMSEQPCLLILSGYNNKSIYRSDQCWLSPVAIATIEDLIQQGTRSTYAYYVFPQRGASLYDVLPMILLQLLRKKSHALRDEKQHSELKAELSELRRYEDLSRENEKCEDDRVAAVHKVALRVINLFDESETVYIIMDRADRCRDWREFDHRKVLLEGLVKMVEAARCKLRVLVVVNGYDWPVEEHKDDLGGKRKARTIVQREVQGERT